MKRTLLIAGGTVGGLGAVLAITPPQLTANESLAPSAPVGLTELDTPSAARVETQSATPQATSPQATATKKAAATKSETPKASVSATPSPVATKVAVTKGVSGAFTGSAVDIGYGIMQVKITVVNGKITEAEAVQTPSGRNDRWTNMAVPVLRQRTLEAQSANINGVSGASYTSYGWYTSLVSALKQAGL